MSISIGYSDFSFGLRDLSGTPGAGGDRTREAAQQFEALLISHLLRQVREAAAEGGDQTMDTILEMAEQRLAEVMAAQGGLGLAGLVARGLKAQ
jgi:Rod binding domain-containing protein